MPLSDFVQIVIAIDAIGIARAGFGIPLILSANAAFADLIRFYTDIPGLAVDWAVTTPEYLAGAALLSQANQPAAIAIGRLTHKPTQQYAIGVNTLTDATAYKFLVSGPGITSTTVSATSATPATFEGTHTALLTAANAVAGKNYTATYAPITFTDQTFTADNATEIFTIVAHGLHTGDGPFQTVNAGGALPTGLAALTDYYFVKLTADTYKLATTRVLALAATPDVAISTNGTGTNTLHAVSALSPTSPIRLTGNATGNWFSCEILDSTGLNSSLAPNYLTNAQVHADPGVASDLNDIQASNGSWYAVYPLYNSQAYGLGVMAWVETSTAAKICVIDTCDTHTITAAAASGSDIGDAAKAAGYDRTLLEYHPSPIDFLGAALMGEVLPLDPGSETWAFKQLIGPRGVKLSATHRVNLRARNMNTYEPQTEDLTWTWDGKTPGGEFLDTVRGLDFVRDDASKSIAEVLASKPKVPYTDGGAVTLGNELEGVFARAVTAQIFAADPKPVVTIPRVSSQTAANRRARKFAGLKGSATLAGAIQDVGPVTITVTQ